MAARRQWAGTTPEERRATRRRALLDAGIAALGAIDGPALTIRTVCRSSGVSERNFYEEFGDRDDFVRAVYQDVLESVMRVVTEFATDGDDLETRAVETFIGATVDNPEYGRIMMLAPFTEPTLGSVGFAGSMAFASLAEKALVDVGDPGRRRFLSVSLVGAASGAIIDYLRGDLGISRDELIDYISRMGRQVSAIFD
ncbi:TetR/AcrR family transcriptional regulator [Mycobacterium sp. D16R24]|uniref:TetR/AcrR family transcriptional regulator n=1 Tax=Mycobacterium sp. D16R24 TaxID=1855656 RepID=UPI0009942459|nr:TetR/AcrR family transcriptional regulator [Mycobacterium sp. D16R24]